MISLGEASPTESRHELGHDVIARHPSGSGGWVARRKNRSQDVI